MRIRAGLLCIIFSFISLSVGSALSESLTYDEVFYLEEGRRIWNMREFADPYNPPLALLLARMPFIFGFDSRTAARLVSVALGVLLVLAVYHIGGLAAATLIAFEPTVLANSHFVTNDIAVTLFVFLTTLAWMRYMKRASKRYTLLLGLSAGYALSSKMTSIVFLPFAYSITGFSRRVNKPWRLIGSAIVAVIVVWAAYLFTWDVVIREREDAGRVSSRLVTYAREHNTPVVENVVTFFRTQPLPLGTYAATVKNNLLRIGKPATVMYDGRLYDQSQWYFMIGNILRKLPVPLLILGLLGMWSAPRYAAIFGGMIGIAAVLGFVPLVRFVLPAIPFLALAGGAGIRVIGGISPTSLKLRGVKGMIIIGLLVWYIVGTVLAYPHFISYANALAGVRERRFEVFTDSNLDWGQALPDVSRYIKQENPAKVRFSYFGRDDAAQYGLPSIQPYGRWRFEDICAFHDIVRDSPLGSEMTVISASNWYYCGYDKEEAFRKENIRDVVAEVFLVF